MVKVISFFNHKGGVGKTTQLHNVAWALSKKGKRVLMVDADSQCNLSIANLSIDGFEEHYQKFPNDNIKSGVDPAFMSKPSLIKAVECPQIDDDGNLYLLPGSYDITNTETQLSVAINFNVTFLTMTNLPGAFYYLIKKCAEKYNIDYVLIDLNPSLSAINQTLLFSSNYFVLPCGVDYFSKQAITSLSKTLPQWCDWSEKAKEHFKDSVYPLPEYKTKFMGYTVNNYNVRNKKPTGQVQNIIEILNDEVEKELVPVLLKTHNALNISNYRIAEINSFNTLSQYAHEVGKPVINLTTNDTGRSGAVATQQEETINTFREKFEKFADFLITNAE